jgi:hypothetical protein
LFRRRDNISNARNWKVSSWRMTEGKGVQVHIGKKCTFLYNRWVYNEFMSAELTPNMMYISDLTLSFFQDMGWYIPDYSFSSSLSWGYSLGCSFLNSCSNKDYYCGSLGQYSCTYNKQQVGRCTIG